MTGNGVQLGLPRQTAGRAPWGSLGLPLFVPVSPCLSQCPFVSFPQLGRPERVTGHLMVSFLWVEGK